MADALTTLLDVIRQALFPLPISDQLSILATIEREVTSEIAESAGCTNLTGSVAGESADAGSAAARQTGACLSTDSPAPTAQERLRVAICRDAAESHWQMYETARAERDEALDRLRSLGALAERGEVECPSVWWPREIRALLDVATVEALTAERDQLADAARHVVEEWGDDEWIRATFEDAITALRDALDVNTDHAKDGS